jgi:hypothetical protein
MVELDLIKSKKELTSINACRRLLLTAGADPTYKSHHGSFLDSMATHGNDEVSDSPYIIPSFRINVLSSLQETLALVWNSGLITPFATLQNWRSRDGMSPFLKACTRLDTNKDTISHLMKMGACINDRTSNGETCLQLVLECTDSTTISFESLVFLLEQGADPFAEDNQGRSVSEVAYNKLGLRDEITGSSGDVWDAALHICGWDIGRFRTVRRRKPRYNSFYTRADFEEIWRGREHECPYWDDRLWPPLGPGEEDSDFDRDDISCFGVSDCDTSEDEDQFRQDSRIQEGWSGSEDEEGGALL